MTQKRFVPTEEQLTEVLNGAVSPLTMGEVLYHVACDYGTVDSLGEAKQRLNVYAIERLMAAMVEQGTVLRQRGKTWSSTMRGSFSEGWTYYALATKAQEWQKKNEQETQQRREDAWRRQAHEQAMDELRAAHAEEYQQRYDAALEHAKLEEKP